MKTPKPAAFAAPKSRSRFSTRAVLLDAVTDQTPRDARSLRTSFCGSMTTSAVSYLLDFIVRLLVLEVHCEQPRPRPPVRRSGPAGLRRGSDLAAGIVELCRALPNASGRRRCARSTASRAVTSPYAMVRPTPPGSTSKTRSIISCAVARGSRSRVRGWNSQAPFISSARRCRARRSEAGHEIFTEAEGRACSGTCAGRAGGAVEPPPAPAAHADASAARDGLLAARGGGLASRGRGPERPRRLPRGCSSATTPCIATSRHPGTVQRVDARRRGRPGRPARTPYLMARPGHLWRAAKMTCAGDEPAPPPFL